MDAYPIIIFTFLHYIYICTIYKYDSGVSELQKGAYCILICASQPQPLKGEEQKSPEIGGPAFLKPIRNDLT